MKTKDELLQEFRIQAIREAASRIVAEKGVEGATMDAIAEAAGIAKGTLYLYFKNREDLLEKTAEHALAGLVDEIEGSLASSGSFDEQLRAYILRTLRFFDGERDFFRLYRAVLEHAGRCEVRYQHPQFQRYVQGLTRWLEAAGERGEIRCGNAGRLAYVLADALHTVLLLRAQEGERPPIEGEAAWLASLLLDGIRAQGDHT